jgi:hypothetical protein
MPRKKKPKKSNESDHHHVYVVFLRNPKGDGKGRLLRRHDRFVARAALPESQARHQAARIVRRCGERLVPRLYAHLNPMPYAKAIEMEVALADSLRKRGYVVYGGH